MSLPFKFLSFAALCFGACAIAGEGSSMSKDKSPAPPPLPAIVALELEPATLVLQDARDERRVLVTGRTADGTAIDLTSVAIFKSDSASVAIQPDGYIQAKVAGEAAFIVSAAGKQASLTVSIKGATQPPVRFVRDVMPIIAKAGCKCWSLSRFGERQKRVQAFFARL